MSEQNGLGAVAMFVGLGLLSSGLAADPAKVSPWHQAPLRIMVGQVPLDTIDLSGGHAAPTMVDLDADGKRDLVVGNITGYFFFYKNVGTDDAPLFSAGQPLLDGERKTKLVNWCCMGVAAQFRDIDGDGKVDLTAGSYGGP